MATTHSAPDKGTDDAAPFTATEPVEYIDADAFTSMRAPDALVEDGTAAFAVAQRHGVITIASRDLQFEATATLYLTADGQQAIERYTRRGTAAPRACIVDAAEHLVDADPGVSYTEALSCHPEVA
jgi:hypothetical protein